MGAQQAKSDENPHSQSDEYLHSLHYKTQQQYRTLHGQSEDVATHAAEAEIMNEIDTETVMSEQNPPLVSPIKLIKVANFAKIKIEPRDEDESIKNQRFTIENKGENDNIVVDTSEQQDTALEDIEAYLEEFSSYKTNNINAAEQAAIDNSIACGDVNSSVNLNTPSGITNNCENLSKLQVKSELLEFNTNHINQSDVTPQNSQEEPSVKINIIKTEPLDDPLNNDNTTAEFINPSAAEIKIETVNIENSFEVPVHLIKNTTQNFNINKEVIEIDDEFEKSVEEDIKDEEPQHLQLVRNPLAFSRNLSTQKKSRKRLEFNEINKDDFVNKVIKTDLTDSIAKDELKNTTEIEIVDLVAEQSSINLKELIIKSDLISDSNDQNQQEIYNNSNLNNNCLSYNLNSSLDVNLSNCDVDVDDTLSIKSVEEVISNISINTSAESLKYFSVIELSSVENANSPIKKSGILKDNKSKTKTKFQKTNIRRSYRSGQKKNISYSNQCKVTKVNKRGKNPKLGNKKSRKYSEKDYSYNTGVLTKNFIKKLPKTCIKTRRKLCKPRTPKKTTNNTTKTDFPKPFKTESSTIAQKDHNIATELPKPMMFKLEKDIVNVKDKQHYLKPELQPFVRLKRLKSEELLVPLKSKRNRRIKTFNSTSNGDKRLNYPRTSNDNRREFLIQQAFSLNHRLKLNRLSIDHDHSFFNIDQPSLYSRLTTPYSMAATDTTNESLPETDSKYFNPQELFQHSSTPDASSSIFGSHIDSGVSTTAPDSNKTLLLEIAAERAFINNHLEHFGYSSIQFNLYNNLNDLNVFLKYLLGPVNLN